jgi:hypothetical protein
MWSKRTTVSVSLFGLVLLGLGTIEAATRPGLVLFTPEEASGLRFGAGEWRPPVVLRSIPPGPRVVVQHPTVEQTADGATILTGSPTDLRISFEPTRAPVDMESLEVRAKKAIFSVSLTDRLKPYLRGTNLEATGVNVPEGRFLIQIEIADKSGQKTVETYRLEVKQP